MKKRKKRIVATVALIFMLTRSLSVFAADSTLIENNEQIVCIDAQQATEETGMTLEEVFGSKATRATSMPTATWDWGNGTYYGTFDISYEYSYTCYNFSGYSQYYVKTQAVRDVWTAASDNYTVYLMKGSGQGTIVTSYSFNSTDWKTVRFYNLDAGTKYAVCFSKANDGSTLSGSFYIYT